MLNAHLFSATMLAIYLIVGCALAVLSLIGVAYSEQLSDSQTWLPYAAMTSMVLWFALGAWFLHQHQRKLDTCHNTYSSYIQRHTSQAIKRPSIESLTSDEPWELQAFWAEQYKSRPSHNKPTHHAQPSVSFTKIPAAAQIPRAIPPSAAAWDASATLNDIEVIATVEGHRTLRPISLFGSVQ